MSGTALSADFPPELHGEHAVMMPEKNLNHVSHTHRYGTISTYPQRGSNKMPLTFLHEINHLDILPQGFHDGIPHLRGKAQLESSLLFNDQHPLLVADSRRPDGASAKMSFDPTVSKAFMRKMPAKLLLAVSPVMSL